MYLGCLHCLYSFVYCVCIFVHCVCIYLFLFIDNIYIPYWYLVYRKDTSLLYKIGIPFDQLKKQFHAALKFSIIKCAYT